MTFALHRFTNSCDILQSSMYPTCQDYAWLASPVEFAGMEFSLYAQTQEVRLAQQQLLLCTHSLVQNHSKAFRCLLEPRKRQNYSLWLKVLNLCLRSYFTAIYSEKKGRLRFRKVTNPETVLVLNKSATNKVQSNTVKHNKKLGVKIGNPAPSAWRRSESRLVSDGPSRNHSKALQGP